MGVVTQETIIPGTPRRNSRPKRTSRAQKDEAGLDVELGEDRRLEEARGADGVADDHSEHEGPEDVFQVVVVQEVLAREDEGK